MATVLQTPPALGRSGSTGLADYRQDIQETYMDPNSK